MQAAPTSGLACLRLSALLRIAHHAAAARLTQVHQLDKDVAVACADFQAAQDAAVLRDERLAMSVDEMRNVVGSTKRSLADVAETVSSFVSRSPPHCRAASATAARRFLAAWPRRRIYQTMPRVKSPLSASLGRAGHAPA